MATDTTEYPILADRESIAKFRTALADMWDALAVSSLFDQSNTATARFRLGHKLDCAVQDVSKLLGDWQALYDDACSAS